MKTYTITIACLVLASSVIAAEEVDNPLFSNWPTASGTKVQFDRTTHISGGLPLPGNAARPPAKRKVTYELVKATSEELTIKLHEPDFTNIFTIPAKVAKGSPNLPKLTKTEELKIGDKTHTCKVYEYTSTTVAETGTLIGPQNRNDFPVINVTVWVSHEVPGGVVRRKMSLLEKASYEIEDILDSSALSR